MDVRFAPILGRAMKTLREQRGWSQEAVSRRVEGFLSRETVRRIESGEETTTTTIDRVLTAMGYDAYDLLREIDATRVKLQGRRARSFARPRQAPLAVALS